MSLALIVPALVAGFCAPLDRSSEASPAAGEPVIVEPSSVVAGYAVEATVPSLFVEGQPFEVTLTITAKPEKSTKIPSWFLSPAAWSVDGKPLMRRAKSVDLVLLPGQSFVTKLDLAKLLVERMKGDGRDFRIKFTEGLKKAQTVFWLAPPASGINFMTLPKEQLDGYQVVLQTTGGLVWIDLWPDVAPNHVRNFLDLAATGYYDGSPFHRAIPGFMVQVGRARDGTAAPRKLDEEFNSRRHAAGVVAAARLGNDINSAGSEFFIVHKPSPHLDGSYTAFGQVVVGMEAVDRIVKAVEIHYELVGALKREGIELDMTTKAVAVPVNTPNPAQEIQQALVVRASKSRPKRSK